MLKFLKNWTLPLAMFAGAIGYFLLANVTILEPAKPFVNWLIAVLTSGENTKYRLVGAEWTSF